ncbi:MAG: shikimate kinase [Chloroflexi bacterium]|nr:shikimate kinase [Chloroflexota bacterium]
MGTGKSTVGRLLAARLEYDFVDTDELIAARDGRSIAKIFHESGQFAFRRWEAVISQELAGREGLVIATGGRLMLDEMNAVALSRDAYVFCLTAVPETILERLVDDGGVRPLLDVSNPTQAIMDLLAERREGYGRFPQIVTDNKTPDQIVAEILQVI